MVLETITLSDALCVPIPHPDHALRRPANPRAPQKNTRNPAAHQIQPKKTRGHSWLDGLAPPPPPSAPPLPGWLAGCLPALAGCLSACLPGCLGVRVYLQAHLLAATLALLPVFPGCPPYGWLAGWPAGLQAGRSAAWLHGWLSEAIPKSEARSQAAAAWLAIPEEGNPVREKPLLPPLPQEPPPPRGGRETSDITTGRRGKIPGCPASSRVLIDGDVVVDTRTGASPG